MALPRHHVIVEYVWKQLGFNKAMGGFPALLLLCSGVDGDKKTVYMGVSSGISHPGPSPSR